MIELPRGRRRRRRWRCPTCGKRCVEAGSYLGDFLGLGQLLRCGGVVPRAVWIEGTLMKLNSMAQQAHQLRAPSLAEILDAQRGSR